jgi:eukaryotic-like serine/threonine-protein kinase
MASAENARAASGSFATAGPARNEEARHSDGPSGAAPVAPGQLSALLGELARADRGTSQAWDSGLYRGAVIGRFELVRELGRGGFGVVWEARDRELGRAVAFKAIRVSARGASGDGADAAGVEPRLREAEAAARLSHPSIVTLFDVGRTEQGPYLVLELLRGQTLAHRLEQARMPVREALRIAVEVATGLAHAHEHGVVHRDLTPGNIFLCDDGQVKLLDLGMAHAFGLGKAEGGTPGFMAPEQWRDEPEDHRADLFSLGVVLHRMLANELPFPADRAPSGRPETALDVLEHPALGELVARMLETDPMKRPRDAGEGSAFGRALATVRTWRRSMPVRLVTWFGAVFLLVGATFLAVRFGVERRRLEDTETARAGRRAIVVLPFTDVGAMDEQDLFLDALTEEVAERLVRPRTRALRVAARSSNPVNIQALARQLGVEIVLEGNVQRDRDTVRVTVQLLNAADGRPLWSGRYERASTEASVLGLAEIAQKIAGDVDAALQALQKEAARP